MYQKEGNYNYYSIKNANNGFIRIFLSYLQLLEIQFYINLYTTSISDSVCTSNVFANYRNLIV